MFAEQNPEFTSRGPAPEAAAPEVQLTAKEAPAEAASDPNKKFWVEGEVEAKGLSASTVARLK